MRKTTAYKTCFQQPNHYTSKMPPKSNHSGGCISWLGIKPEEGWEGGGGVQAHLCDEGFLGSSI